jgi:hypothetical protein
MVMELSVKPAQLISAKVLMMLMGMLTAAISVLRRFPRNSSTTSAARNDPTMRCSFTAPIALPTNSD